MNNKEVIRIWSENQKLGAVLPCPRCGKWKMKPELHTNALSRRADIYICDSCGTLEALCDMQKVTDGFDLWYISKFFENGYVIYDFDDTAKSYKLKVPTQRNVTVTCDDIDDIMCGALTGGINYWCRKAEVVGEYLGEYGSEQISRGGTLKLYDAEEDEVYELTLAKFMRGLMLAIEAGFDREYGWLNDDGTLDCCQIDAGEADAIIQLAIFEEVIYG